MKSVQRQYLEYELRGNDAFWWVVGNIIPQMQRYKNTGEGLIIP